jgi:hypothetical protein
MGQTSGQIERHIQKTRNDLGDNFTELEEKVKTAMDWRNQFEERPMTMIALAFGGGILLSALLPRRRSTRSRTSGNRGSAPSGIEGGSSSVKSSSTLNGEAAQIGETWEVLKDALVGVAASKLSGFVEDLLPGFKQEFSNAKTGKSSVGSASPISGQPTWQKASAAEAD